MSMGERLELYNFFILFYWVSNGRNYSDITHFVDGNVRFLNCFFKFHAIYSLIAYQGFHDWRNIVTALLYSFFGYHSKAFRNYGGGPPLVSPIGDSLQQLLVIEHSL